MKRIIAVVLTLIMSAALVCCGQSGEISSNQSGFVKPEGYVSVVQIAINPTVNLYLDGQDKILAVEYVNNDAKESYTEIENELIGKNVSQGVNLVVTTAEQKGYVVKNCEVKINIVEAAEAQKGESVLKAVAQEVVQKLDELKIEATVSAFNGGKEVEDLDISIGEENVSSEPEVPEHNETSSTVVSQPTVENQKKKLKMGAVYRGGRHSGDGSLIYHVKITFTEQGYSATFTEYTKEKFEQSTETYIFNGVTYWDSASSGDGGEYVVSGDIVNCVDSDVILQIDQNGDLVLQNNGFGMFAGAIFSIWE